MKNQNKSTIRSASSSSLQQTRLVNPVSISKTTVLNVASVPNLDHQDPLQEEETTDRKEAIPFQQEEEQEETTVTTTSTTTKNNLLTSTQKIRQFMNAAFLVAGTTIGGGFLALPSVAAPTGFIPATTGMILVWTFFLLQSFTMVEIIHNTRLGNGNSDMNTNMQQPQLQQEHPSGLTAAAKATFGKRGEVFVGVVLTFLIQAILVAQISKAGQLFPNYRIGCLASAFSVAGLVFGTKSGVVFASNANAALTSIFLLSTFCVFQCGWNIANFTILQQAHWKFLNKSIPSLLQVLAYGEIIPTVCQVLNYNTRRIHRAIIVGTLMTLSLQISWSGLGLSLASGASAVDTLLKASGPVRFPMWTLSISAILTTILGGYLALLSAVNDFIKDFMPLKKKREGSDIRMETIEDTQQVKDFCPENANSIWDRLKIAVGIAFPASIIACISPDIFLKVINFSGSYPILLMWGIIPPVVALKQRANLKDEAMNFQKSAGSSFRLASLVVISLAMMGSCAYSDVTSMVRRFF